MFGLSTSLPSDSGSLPLPGRPASADELLREVAACRKRSNILLALTYAVVVFSILVQGMSIGAVTRRATRDRAGTDPKSG